jgi:hypothetical protein
MTGNGLFGDLPGQAAPQGDASPLGTPRLREPERGQIELLAVDIDSLIGEDHPARVIWAYVAELDLSELEDRIKARENIQLFRRGFCWRCGSLLPATAWAARAPWSGCATATTSIAGCAEAYR